MTFRDHYLYKIRPYYRQVAGMFVLGITSGIIMNISVVLPAIYLGRALDAALALSSGDGSMQALISASLFYVGGSALNLVGQIGKRWWMRMANHRTVANMRANAIRGVLAWPMERLHSEPVGDIMARIIGDTQVFMVGFNEATTELFDTWLFSISLFVAMLVYDVRLALMAMALVPIAFMLAYYTGNWVRSRTLGMRQAASDLTAALQEYLSGVRILKLFGRSQQAVRRVDALSESVRQANLAELRLRLGLQPVYSILVTSGVLMVVWLGGRRVLAETLTIGTLVAFIQLYLRFVGRGHRIPMFFNRIQAAGVAYDRLEPMLAPVPPLDDEPRLARFMPNRMTGIDDPPPPPPPVESGPIAARLRRVTFAYPDSERPALLDVSLDIPKGSLTAITGPIGSGKSALLRVLMGLYSPDEGSIEVGERPIAGWPADEHALRIGYLPQDPALFAGTVRANLGLDAPDPDLEERLIARAGLAQDVQGFSQGLDTLTGEGGVRISGGQRQRIALARALAAGRGEYLGMLLLDDPFAAIDVDTEGQIIAALRQAYGVDAPPQQRATLVLCSHRLAAFPNADQIIVLDQGRIVERGTHDRLVESDGLYARIYRAQHQIMQSAPGSEAR